MGSGGEEGERKTLEKLLAFPGFGSGLVDLFLKRH